MNKTIPFAIPDIGDAEIEEVVAALKSGWITTGPRTKRFEQAFRERVDAPHGVAVNSCTAAMHLALEAIGVQSGDEVIVPTMTFAATAEVVRYLDAKPVLVDIRPSNHCVDVQAVERAVTEKTRAIIPVHFAGQSCHLQPLLELARDRNLVVIEDAAHAFPASYRGRPIGSIGDITCFSFYATKTLTTGEGGIATTAREDWADRMRVMSLHGISKDAWKRYTAEGSWYYEIEAPGYKYNMTDIAAALGLVQLGRADELLERRREIAQRYRATLEDQSAVELLEAQPFSDHAWHLFVIKLRTEQLNIDRNTFIQELKGLGVDASVHFIPLHLHPYYRSQLGCSPEDFPIALDCFERSISLPIYTKMTMSDVDRVCDSVVRLLERHHR